MTQPKALSYPKTKKSDHTDDYHGTLIKDPYRWLEQPSETPEVNDWIEAQNELSSAFLRNIPERKRIHERLNELWDYPKDSAPFKKADRYFQFRNTGLQNQSVLFVMASLEDEGHVLLDPNALTDDGTAALNNLSISPDGNYLAYAVSQSGSDWQTWFVRDVKTGKDLANKLEWSKFSGATWLPDSSGFYYSQYPTPTESNALTQANENPRVFLHKVAAKQEQDTLIYERPDEPKWMFATSISDDDKFLILSIRRDTRPINLIYVRDLTSNGDFKPLIDVWEADYSFIGNEGSDFYFHTDLEASKGRIIAVDIRHPEKANWRTLVPESDDTLQLVKLVQNQFICVYMKHASHVLKRFTTAGEDLGIITLPTLGSLMALNTQRDDTEVLYSFTSFLFPTISFKFDLNTSQNTQLSNSSVNFDVAAFETKQIFVNSKDGTKVPLFLLHKKGLELNGENPALLYGYGGFNIALTPSFSVSRLAWLELGGVLAIANLRGGGEYGKAWHEAGTVHKKQNVFDDFIACAEHLIDEGFSSAKKLAIQGGSNGGLLVGAAMTQRPELFAAVLPAVGVMDMLRFHKFTIGWAWVGDYGSADDEAEFKTLLEYSPLHNLKAGTAYPATLVTTGDHDDRVVPAHSFKFAATLQETHTGDTPTLIRIQTKAGHGAGKPTTMLIDEQADIWAFLVKVLDIDLSATSL